MVVDTEEILVEEAVEMILSEATIHSAEETTTMAEEDSLRTELEFALLMMAVIAEEIKWEAVNTTNTKILSVRFTFHSYNL